MFSASQEEEFQTKAREVGALKVVNKPFVAELLQEMKQIFSGTYIDEEKLA